LKNLTYSLKDSRNGALWTSFHVVLGILSTISPFVVVLWFYCFFIYQLINIIRSGGNQTPLNIAELLIYSSAYELLSRMADSSPFIPYELGKYTIFFLCSLGFLFSKNTSSSKWIGILILILIMPSFFIDLSGSVTFQDLRYNLLGLINVGLVIIFFSSLDINSSTFFKWIRLMIYPAISVLAFAIFKTPDYDELEFSLGANFDTTGGFGSNQVSTVLGFGAFLMVVALILRKRISGFIIIDYLLLAAFVIQGLLTFSRGGMLVAALALIAFFYYVLKLNTVEKASYKIPNLGKYFLPLIVLLTVLAIIANTLTGGLLLLRYQGETAGTISGSKEVDLNHFTTNRYDIFLSDIDLWLEYPMFGVGAAASPFLRKFHKGQSPHTEMSRILAEHGSLGILIILLLAYLIYYKSRNSSNYLIQAMIISLFIISILTSFHAATRTFISPLLIGIICVNIFIPAKENDEKLESSL